MNPLSLKEAERLYKGIAKGVSAVRKTDVVLCAPFLYLEKLKKISKKIGLGAENAFPGDVGAFTGEISAEMLYEIGARYVILGHSERRGMGESNEEINKKIKSALTSGLSPILCVGEKERDTDHNYFNFIKDEIEICLDGISKNYLSKILVAYEPIWAISTTANHRDATADDAREMSIFIRKVLFDKFGKESTATRVLYGGSVNEKSAQNFLNDDTIEGLLIGHASLDAKKFLEIIKICETSGKSKI